MNVVLAVGLDSLLTLLVFIIIAAVSSWLKKKVQPEDTDGSPSAPPGQPPRPGNWEEELRRLLGGETPRAPAPPVITPPEPVDQPAEGPAPVRPRPARPTPARRMPGRPQPALPRAQVPAPAALQPARSRSAQPQQLVREARAVMATAVSKLEHAQEQTRELDRAARRVVGLAQQRIREELTGTAAAASRGAADRVMGRALLLDRHSLRAAWVASIVLGPPRGLEDQAVWNR